MDRHTISGGGLTAIVKADGAELCSLRDGSDHEYIWQAGPAWPRHAPVLFPIVGRLKDDRLSHDGRTYRMTQHGFARDRRFAWSSRNEAACGLVLEDDAATRAMYPFAFRFEMAYALGEDGLVTTFTVTNPGSEPLPASMGGHPAFSWPLDAGAAKDRHRLIFSDDEPAPLRGVTGGLLTAADRPSPVIGNRLDLTEDLFAEDALIFDAPRSRGVTFEGPGTRWLSVAWDGFPQLGLWSRPDSDFLCIEPWAGMASPAEFDGDFIDKPWLMLIAPGARRSASFRIAVGTR